MSRHAGRREQSEQRRAAVFDALRALLLERPWGEVTLEAVAQEAGVSRQTLYNTFGSRVGLAEAYTRRLADSLVEVITAEIAGHGGEPRAGLAAGYALYLEIADADPLVARVRSGEAHHDLVRLVTSGAGPLLAHVAGRLADAVRTTWVGVPEERVAPLASTLARLALSHLVTPPGDDESPAAVAAGLSEVLVGDAPLSARRS